MNSFISKRERDTVLILCVAAIFVLAIVYSVYSATTVDSNVVTGGDVSSQNIYASSTVQATGVGRFYSDVFVTSNVYATGTVQATGNGIFYASLSAGASTNTPTTTFNVTGSGYLTGGLGVGFATTGTGQLHITGFGMFESRVGVNGTSSPAVEFGVTGSGLVSGGFGVGYATTSGLRVSGLAALSNRLGVNATTSPYQELGVEGDVALNSQATTTISFESTSATQGGCIEFEQASTVDEAGQNPGASRWIRIYPGRGSLVIASSTNSSIGLVIERGRCQ